jgi:hypothetical protein
MRRLRALGFCLLLPALVCAAEEEGFEVGIKDCVSMPVGAFSDGVLTLKLGEVACLELKAAAGKLEVSETRAPASKENLLIVKFFRKADQHYLYLTNGSAHLLKYRAQMQVGPNTTFEHTSACPVAPHAAGVESWPHPIVQMRISELRVLEGVSAITCD